MFMRMKLTSLFAILLALIIVVPVMNGCTQLASYFLYEWIEGEFDKDQEEPAIKRVSVDREEVHTGESVVLEVEAEDNNDNENDLDYFWVASEGILINPTSRITVWQAPDEPGTVTISIIVKDTDDYEDSATVEIEVLE